MKKRLLSIMLTVIMGATLLVGCGGNSSKGSAAEAEPGKLKGEITFWHSFTQGARLETIQAVADQFMKDILKWKLILKLFLGEIFIQSGQPVLLQEMYQI